MAFLKDGAWWKKQIDLALQVRRQVEPWAEANLQAYAPRHADSPENYGKNINTNRDYTLVERKKADTFYQRPDVVLQPTPLSEQPITDPVTGQPLLDPNGQQIVASVALAAHQQIVNEKLGDDGVQATRMAHAALFDVYTFGVGFTKMGYEAVMGSAPDPRDPTMTAMVPVPIKEHCYWEHYSPKRAVVPHDFRSTEWDKAPFLGYQFTLPLTSANRQKYRLPEDYTGSKPDATQYFDHGSGTVDPGQDMFTGVELWYRSVLYRDDVLDPDHLTHLVLVDGMEAPVLEEDCPEQTLDPRGVLTPDSLVGFPVHPLNTRTLTDTCWVPADCTLTRPLINELNVSREQNIQFRDAMTLRWQYNTDTLPPDALNKIVRSPIGGMIGVPGEAFVGEGAIKELPQGTMPRENFAIADYIDQDISRSWALDSNQQGIQASRAQTASEAQLQQANANARLDWERGIVLAWYVRGVTKFSTLILRYLPVEQAAQIVGPGLAAIWDAWRKTGVNSALAFTAMPDSALRVDQAVDRQSFREFYSYVANDPFFQKGRGKLAEKLCRKHHVDPNGIVIPPDPPAPTPKDLSLSFKGEDLIAPQAPIVLEILQQMGYKFSEAAIMASQQALADAQQQAAAEAQAKEGQKGDTTHGGKLEKQSPLDKHTGENTGAMQNTGMPGGMGAAGGFLQ